jgi:ABC-type sugar transport system substrate-binding protein
VGLVALTVACNRGTTTTTTQQQQAPAGPRIALVLKTLNSPFFIDMQKARRKPRRG